MFNSFFIAYFLLIIGTEFKTAACPVSGVIHYMDIQHGKEGMKAAKFSSTMGATSGCTIRLLLNSIPVERQGEKHGIRGDAWFGSVNTANEVGI